MTKFYKDSSSPLALSLAMGALAWAALTGCGADEGASDDATGGTNTGGEVATDGSGGSASGQGSGGDGGGGDGSGGDGSGGSATFSWTAQIQSGEDLSSGAHSQASGTLRCAVGDSGLHLYVEAMSEVASCQQASPPVLNQLTLRIPGYSATAPSSYEVDSASNGALAAVLLSTPHQGDYCMSLSGADWNGCSFDSTVSEGRHELLVECWDNSVQAKRLTASLNFDPRDCDGVDSTFSSCVGSPQLCSGVSLDVCDDYDGCTKSVSCRPYGNGECAEIASQSQCGGKTGCLWVDGACYGVKGEASCPLAADASECTSAGCVAETTCSGATECGGKDEVACAGLPACSLNFGG